MSTDQVQTFDVDFTRHGLAESLEAYAARLKLSVSDARPIWRAEGALALGADYGSESHCSALHASALCWIPVRVPVPNATIHERGELIAYEAYLPEHQCDDY